MMNKRILFISIFVLMIVLSIGAVSAQDADGAVASNSDDSVLEDAVPISSGTASGGVDVVTENPGDYGGELSYDVPSDAKTIKSADVYVNVYGVKTDDTYGANVNTTVKTANANKTYTEELCYVNNEEDHSIIHNVNDHVTKCYLDYTIHYDITDLVSGLNGTKLTVNVDTFKMENKSFDGKIKLIALVFAYNDDSTDETISYWINSNQLWTKSNVTLDFNTEGKSGISTLTNVVLSSVDGAYKMNGEFLGDAKEHVSGDYYYQYNKWDVTSAIDKDKNTSLNVAYAGSSTYGSIKNALSVLTINDVKTTMAVATEYSKTVFAGTNNTLAVTVSANKAGKYVVRLLADNEVVYEIEADLDSTSQIVYLTDPTIRDVDNSTVKGADNKKVNYTVELLLNDQIVNSTSLKNLLVLYNGNLGKDLAYPASGMESFLNIVVNGDIVIDAQAASTYLKGADNLRNRTDVWNVNLDENSTIVKAFIYIPYNWFDPSLATEDLTMFNTTFNGAKITPVTMYRDQSNLGTYGAYGYGVVVYDVSALVNKSGDNSLFVSRAAKYPAIYPSVLVYMYNTTGSKSIKEIYINNGADLLSDHTSSLKNYANRTVKMDSTIKVDSKVTSNAKLYVVASNALPTYGNIVFNGERHENVWNGESSCTIYYELDVTDKIKDSNSVSFEATNGNILALQQIMVLTKELDDVDVSLATEYKNTAYAGTNNAITVTVEALKEANFTAKLLADNVVVNKTEINVVAGTNNFVIIDPTIRDVDETTVNGATNKKVNYTIQLASGDKDIKNATISVPILYNGNLGKDLAYPAGGMESFLNITINGDIVIDAQAASTKLGSSDMNRTDVWKVNLDAKSSIVKAYIYVPYNWFNVKLLKEDINMFDITFNGANITPVAMYRDQSNLGSYGNYGYGVLVFDVTDLIAKSGDNTLVLNKKVGTPSVYPSALIYMYNTTVSNTVKNVYMLNGADLLSGTSSNVAKRLVKADSTINVANIEDTATLYVLASNAMANYGNIVFNGETHENVWSGDSYATGLFTLDITKTIENSNNVSFVATGGTILALNQIIVTAKKVPIETIVTPKALTTTYDSGKYFTVSVLDAAKNPVKCITLYLKVYTGKKYNVFEVTTNAKGIAAFTLASRLVPGTHIVEITSNSKDYNVKKTTSAIKIAKAKTLVKAPKVTAKYKKAKLFKVLVVNKATKKAVKNIKVKVKVYTGKKYKIYTIKTDKKGIAKLSTKKLKVGSHKVLITSGNAKYVISKASKIVIKK